MTRTYAMPDMAATAARIKALGGPVIDPTKATGEIKYSGCTFDYAYADGKVAITLTHKPFYAPESTVAGKLDGFFGVAL